MAASGTGNEPHFDWSDPAGPPAREVWYGTVAHPTDRVALWYRYTLVRTAETAEARVWAALSTAGTTGPRDAFVSSRFDLESVTLASPFSLSIGEANRLADDGAAGRLAGPDTHIEWSLAHRPDDCTFTPLADEDRMREWADRFGSGVHWSANQSVSMDGAVTVDGTTLSLEGAPGHQGHTAGTDAPDDLVWTHCNALGAGTDVSTEVLAIGEFTPVCLRLPDRTVMVNDHERVFGDDLTVLEAGPDRWAARLETAACTATWRVAADPDHWQLVSYLVPDGSLRYNAHCSLAAVDLTVEVDGRERSLSSDRGRIEWVAADPPVPGEYPPFAGDPAD